MTGAATQVTAVSAVAGGTLTPGINKKGTLFWFEFGPTAAYGRSTAQQWTKSSTVPVPATAALAGLAAGTTYHFRLVAWGQYGQSRGADRTFSTAGTVPPPPPPPPPPTAGPGLGTQFHCLWDALHERRAHDGAGQAEGRRRELGAGSTPPGPASRTRCKGARNQWYLAKLDYCVNEAGKRGIKVLVTLWWTPTWANGGGARSRAAVQPAGLRRLRALGSRATSAAACRPGRSGTSPNYPSQSYWTGTTQQYVDLLEARLPRLQGRRPEHARRPRRPLVERRRLDRAGLRLRREGLVRRARDAPVPGARRRGARDRGHGRSLVVHAPAGRPQRDGRVRRRRHSRSGSPSSAGRLTANWDGVENWNRGVTDAAAGRLPRSARSPTRALNYPYVTGMFWYKERAWSTSATTGSALHLEGYGLLRADLSERPALGALRALPHRNVDPVGMAEELRRRARATWAAGDWDTLREADRAGRRGRPRPHRPPSRPRPAGRRHGHGRQRRDPGCASRCERRRPGHRARALRARPAPRGRGGRRRSSGSRATLRTCRSPTRASTASSRRSARCSRRITSAPPPSSSASAAPAAASR